MINPINTYLEHTNLNPLITSDQVEQLVAEAVQYQFVGVCVPPFWVKKARRDVGNAGVSVVTVIGFPLGYQRSEAKLREIELALADGAHELDVVMNLSAMKTGTYFWAKAELARFAKTAHEGNAMLKVILETAYLSEEEIVRACKIAQDAGADFVKTSTGFAPAGAKEEHIRLMRSSVSDSVGVKASGGIKTYEQALRMIQAGADRIGTSSAVQIMREKTAAEH